MVKFLTKLLTAFLPLAVPLAAELVCVQQPQSNLYYRDAAGNKTQAAEWACSGGTKREAFELLADANLGPMAFAKVDQLARRVKARSRKTIAGHILEGAKVVMPYLAFKIEGLSDAERALVAGWPQLVQKGGQLIAGFPDEFERTPEQDGFVTLYSFRTDAKTVRDWAPPPDPGPQLRRQNDRAALALIASYESVVDGL